MSLGIAFGPAYAPPVGPGRTREATFGHQSLSRLQDDEPVRFRSRRKVVRVDRMGYRLEAEKVGVGSRREENIRVDGEAWQYVERQISIIPKDSGLAFPTRETIVDPGRG